MPGRTQQRIRTVLGPTWTRILDADVRGQSARPRNPRRHLLAAIYENAGRFNLEEVANQYPGRLPDFLALVAMANILERSRDFPVFNELVSSMVPQEGFRHHMLTLGLADHLRTHTPYPVDLPVPEGHGRRTVDLRLGHPSGAVLEVETATSDEFDGPRRRVTSSNARGAIARAWRRKVSGTSAQLGTQGPGLLLLGGLTLEVSSLQVVREAAAEWLARKGQSHPTIMGIAALTYWTYTLGEPRFPSAVPLTIHARGGVQIAAAENPYYTGPIRIVWTPYVQDESMEPASDPGGGG